MSLIDLCLDKLVNKKATEILDEKISDIWLFRRTKKERRK